MHSKQCPRCSAVWGTEEIEEDSCGACGYPDQDDADENDFQPCEDCDLPDACDDFGCAIKSGIKKPPNF